MKRSSHANSKKSRSYISEATLTTLIEGSYEATLTSLHEAFDLGRWRVLATFPAHVVMCTESGDFYKVPYTHAGESVELGKAVRLSVPVLSEASIREEDLSHTEVVTQAVQYVTSPRMWKRVYEQRRGVIEGLVGDKKGQRSAPTFAFMTPDVLRSDSYRRLVTHGLGVLRENIDELKGSVGDLFSRLPKDAISEAGVLEQSFSAFTQDLLADLGSLSAVVGNVTEAIPDAVILARFHDAVAGALPQYEMAGNFVNAVVRKIISEG